MTILSLGTFEFIGIIISIILIYVVHFYCKYFTRPNPLPGPIPLPVVGNAFGIIFQGKGDISKWFKLLTEKYGDIFETYVESSRLIVFSRAEYVEKILAPSINSPYMIRLDNLSAIEDLGELGKGILMNHHIPSWRYNRQFLTNAILTPSFSKEVLYWTVILFHELNEYWKEIGENTSIDFAVWIHKFTTDIIFQMVVGFKANAMIAYFNNIVEPSKKKNIIKSNLVVENIENFAEITTARLDDLSFVFYYPAFIRRTILKKRNQAMFENRKKSAEVMLKIVDYRRKEIEKTPIEEELRHDMLTSLITANTERDINKSKHVDEEYSRPLTDEEISSILFEAIAGGIDTTSNLLSFIVYYLVHYPNVLDRLQQELDSIFGSDQNRSPTMEDLSKMHYVDAIIKECSRLVNPVKQVKRVSSSSDVVAGYEWSANTTFIVNTEGIHHNSAHWEDPYKFNPDRFIGTEPQKNTFLMFGGGLRICPGRRLAIVELKCLIALIYRNLDITLVDMNAPLKLKNNIVNACTELQIRVKQRKL